MAAATFTSRPDPSHCNVDFLKSSSHCNVKVQALPWNLHLDWCLRSTWSLDQAPLVLGSTPCNDSSLRTFVFKWQLLQLFTFTFYKFILLACSRDFSRSLRWRQQCLSTPGTWKPSYWIDNSLSSGDLFVFVLGAINVISLMIKTELQKRKKDNHHFEHLVSLGFCSAALRAVFHTKYWAQQGKV